MGIKDELLSGDKRIAVWGTGFIGFTTMAYMAFNGIKTIGLDVDKEKIDLINKGEIPIENLEYWLGFDIKALVERKMLEATDDYNNLLKKDVAVHFVCIPTEMGGEPYDNILVDVITKLTKLKGVSHEKPPIVIVESTLTPGRSDEIVLPIFKKAGIEVGKDILYGVAPRRDWFVSPEKSLKNLPRVFGGTTPETTKLMKDALSVVCNHLVPAPDHKHAEIVKSIENAYRHMEIALANQLSLAYPDINMTEVLRLVGTKWNIGTYHPSFGTGGYCIPLASQYVLLGAKHPEKITILKSTIESDREQPLLVAESLKRRGFNNVGILGLAYKGDIKVDILSPTINIVKKLIEIGVNVKVNDPYYTPKEIKNKTGVESFNFPEDIGQFDAVLIVADHQHYKFTPHKNIISSLKNCKLILDNTDIWKDIDFKKAGIEYHVAGDAGWMGN